MYKSVDPIHREFFDFCQENKHRKVIFWSMIGCILLMIILNVKVSLDERALVLDEKKQVVAIQRDVLKHQQAELVVEAKCGNKRIEKTILLSWYEKKRSKAKKQDPKMQEVDLNSVLRQVVAETQGKRGERIVLPTESEDGVCFHWKRKRHREGLLFLFFPPLLLLLWFGEEKKKQSDIRKARQDSIRIDLPSFQSELLLLLRSGLILQDAFSHIASAYRRNESKSEFRSIIIRIQRQMEEENRSLLAVFMEWDEAIRVREFSRLGRWITENQLRGVDLSQRLEQEQEDLWKQRKKIAEDRGKVAESKLAIPLAMLLVVLLIITATPAFLQMKGG